MVIFVQFLWLVYMASAASSPGPPGVLFGVFGAIACVGHVATITGKSSAPGSLVDHMTLVECNNSKSLTSFDRL